MKTKKLNLEELQAVNGGYRESPGTCVYFRDRWRYVLRLGWGVRKITWLAKVGFGMFLTCGLDIPYVPWD